LLPPPPPPPPPPPSLVSAESPPSPPPLSILLAVKGEARENNWDCPRSAPPNDNLTVVTRSPSRGAASYRQVGHTSQKGCYNCKTSRSGQSSTTRLIFICHKNQK
jgi:hypothetical protein